MKKEHYLIILGNITKNGRPSKVLAMRLDLAIRLMKRHPSIRCIVSGGVQRDDGATEAIIMKRYMVARGIAPRRIVLEEDSWNTASNFAFSKLLLPSLAARVGIVTSDFHIPRSMAIAKKAGLARAYPVAAASPRLMYPKNALRELLAYGKDWLVGNL